MVKVKINTVQFFACKLILHSALTLALLALINLELHANEIHVSKTGAVRSIREAVRTAERGDVVVVEPGLYKEAGIIITKPIWLRGVAGAVIDGNLKGGSIIRVQSDSVRITGLEIRNVQVGYVDDNAGVSVENARNVEISHCTILDGFFAIHLNRSQRCKISNNRIIAHGDLESNSGNGVHAWTCRDILVENNFIEGHRDGIYFEFMHQGTVIGNHSKNNLRYGLHFMFSDSCSYRNNEFIHNGAGVAVMFTRFVEMFNNRFINNWGPTSYGLLLKEIFDSHIKGNTFDRNSVGIHCEGANRILFEYNKLVNNGYAMRVLASCDQNTIRNNVFDGNTFDVTTNSRTQSNYFNQNYWSSYDGYDLNKDGTGDVPFHPVRLYSLLVEQMPSSVILMHTPFVNILDLTERVIPTVTPETLVDMAPRMSPPTQ